jgi:hypothetical protein
MVAGKIYYDQAPPEAVEMATPDAALLRRYGTPAFQSPGRMSWGEYGRASLEYTWIAFQDGYSLELKDERFMNAEHDALLAVHHAARPVAKPKF